MRLMADSGKLTSLSSPRTPSERRRTSRQTSGTAASVSLRKLTQTLERNVPLGNPRYQHGE